MRIGLGLLRLPSAQLWTMTPREFAAAVEWLAPRDQIPSRRDLTDLMRRFPDSRTS